MFRKFLLWYRFKIAYMCVFMTFILAVNLDDHIDKM